MLQLKSGHFYQSFWVFGFITFILYMLFPLHLAGDSPLLLPSVLCTWKSCLTFVHSTFYWTNHNVLKYYSTTYPGTDLVLCARKQPHKIEWICMPWAQGITVTSFFWSNWKAYMNEDLLFKTMLLSLSCKKQCKIFIISNSVAPIKHQRET